MGADEIGNSGNNNNSNSNPKLIPGIPEINFQAPEKLNSELTITAPKFGLKNEARQTEEDDMGQPNAGMAILSRKHVEDVAAGILANGPDDFGEFVTELLDRLFPGSERGA